MAQEWVPRKKTRETQERHRTSIFWENVLSHVWGCRYNDFFRKKYQEIVVFHKHELTMAGTTETEQHGTRTGTEKKKYEKHEKDIERAFFWENVLSHVWRCRYNVFFSKKYQEIVVFHKHELTMAGTTETEQHGTRTGTEKNKHEKHEKDIERAFFLGKCTFACLTLPIQCFFQQKVSRHIVVFHKHKLTMAGTTETERHGTRTGTEKKTWETRERPRTSIFWENVLSHVWRCRYNVFFSKKYQDIVKTQVNDGRNNGTGTTWHEKRYR